MEKIEVQSTSPRSATCSNIVLRTGERVRLVFCPEIVVKPSNPDANDVPPVSLLRWRIVHWPEPWRKLRFNRHPLALPHVRTSFFGRGSACGWYFARR